MLKKIVDRQIKIIYSELADFLYRNKFHRYMIMGFLFFSLFWPGKIFDLVFFLKQPLSGDLRNTITRIFNGQKAGFCHP